MKFVKQVIAVVALTATAGAAVPALPAMADGAASTRNIFLGAAAATYLVIQHNRKVHERYAEDARRQAELQSENSDAWSAYHQEQRAYSEEVAVNAELKREVAYQHKIVEQQRRQLSMLGYHSSADRGRVAATAHRVSAHASAQQVAMTSYGWGQL